MPTKLIHLIFILAICFGLSYASIDEYIQSVEVKFGLPLHYKMRGTVAVPEEIFILTPYKKTKTDKPTLLRNWDKTLHAKVIDKLTQLGVQQIAIDINFREYKNGDKKNKEDEVLAKKIKENQKVLLVQFASEVEHDGRDYVRLRNPINPFSESGVSLAPALLEDSKHRKDAYYPFYSVIHSKEYQPCFAYPPDADLENGVLSGFGEKPYYPRISTLPLALIEHRLITDQSLKNVFNQVLNIKQGFGDGSFCELTKQLRDDLLNNPKLLKELVDDKSLPVELSVWINSLTLIQQQLETLSAIPKVYLNLYGYPQTIDTLSYDEFDQDFEEIDNNLTTNKFKNATVFLGGSFETSDEEKQDNFETAFSKQNLKMSGVELMATAFANLLTNSYLQKYTENQMFWLTLLGCISVFVFNILKRDWLIVGCTVTMGAGYLLGANSMFALHFMWLPIIMPLMGMFLSLLILLSMRFAITKRQKTSLQTYIPASALKTIENAHSKTGTRNLTNGVCMVTDVQGFTQISEALKPTQMSDLISEYFSQIADCIAQSDGEVYLIDGDSLTAVWTGEENIVCQKSATAALKILEQVEKFNQKYPETPFQTRIGMDYGEISLGSIGNKSHQTYAVVGDTVYTASRLEQHNKESNTQLLITDHIAKNLSNSTTSDLGEIKFRGKSKPTRVYQLVAIG